MDANHAPNSSDRLESWQKRYLSGSAVLVGLIQVPLVGYHYPWICALNLIVFLFLHNRLKKTLEAGRLLWSFVFFILLMAELLLLFHVNGLIDAGFLLWALTLGFSSAIFFGISDRRFLYLVFAGVFLVSFAVSGLAAARLPAMNWSELLVLGAGLMALTFLIIGLENILDLNRAELKKLQGLREKHQIDSARFHLFTNIAHEINNPLAIVAGYAELLKKKLEASSDDTALNHNSLLKLKQADARILALAQKLLQYGGQAQAQEKRWILIATLLADIKAQVGSKFTSERCRFSVEGASPYACIWGCPVNLTVALSELTENAVEALRGQEDKRVILHIEIQEKFTVFTVEDNGPGVPDQLVEQIFDPFFSTHKDDVLHKGLGLALSLSIAKQHRGHLAYERSKSLGGSKFTFIIRNGLEQINQ